MNSMGELMERFVLTREDIVKQENLNQIVIPNLVLADGHSLPFIGYSKDALGKNAGKVRRQIFTADLFDDTGSPYRIKIDARKNSISDRVTFIYDGKPFYNPIVGFDALELSSEMLELESIEVLHMKVLDEELCACLRFTWSDGFVFEAHGLDISPAEDDGAVSFHLDLSDLGEIPRLTHESIDRDELESWIITVLDERMRAVLGLNEDGIITGNQRAIH